MLGEIWGVFQKQIWFGGDDTEGVEEVHQEVFVVINKLAKLIVLPSALKDMEGTEWQ